MLQTEVLKFGTSIPTFVKVPIVVDPEDRLVVLQAGRELHKLVHGRGNLARHPGCVVVHCNIRQMLNNHKIELVIC